MNIRIIRTGLAALLLLGMSALALAQAPTTLALSKSLLAVRITHPDEQLKRFAPLLTLVDGVMSSERMPGNAETRRMVASASQALQRMLGTLKKLPGINPTGDLWVVVMPAEVPPAGKPANLPLYVLVPLKDPAAFKVALTKGTRPTQFRYTVCGNYAVGNADRTPAFLTVAPDLKLITTRKVALSLQVANLDMAAVPGTLSPVLAALLQPMHAMLAAQQQNVQRLELGATMTGKDLALEGYTVAVPGSPLANSLADGVTTALPHEFAAYLPDSLAYVNASDPMLPGAPGTAQTLLRVSIGILGAFLPEERSEALQQSLDHLAQQCSQGRVIAVTAPAGAASTTAPQSATADATLLAVYRITGAHDARAALHAFIAELAKSRAEVKEEVWSNTLTFELTPGAEQIGALPVDLVKLTITPPPLSVRSGAAAAAQPVVIPPFALECRITFLPDKMLVAMGPRSQAELAALLQRIQAHTPGFTAGARYREIKAAIGPTARRFESASLLTFCRVMSGWIPPGKQRDQLGMLLSVFPPQQSAILISEEIEPGRLHSVMTIPGEQLDFLYSLLKAGQQLGKK